MKVEENLVKEIEKRVSRRKFKNKEISVEEEVRIVEILEKINENKGLEFKIVVNEGKEVFKGMKSYGLIRGCMTYVALIGDSRNKKIEEKIGYFGEYLVLKLTELGYGTCWIGGTYDDKKAEKEVFLDYGEKIYALIALGKVEKKDGIEKLMSLMSKKKKTNKEIFKGYNKIPEDKKIWIDSGLKLVEKAPSALNRQPWMFSLTNKEEIILEVTNNYNFEKIDMGIAMLHFEQGASLEGIHGNWKKRDNVWKFIIGEESENRNI